jgi:hypothetical protein
MVLEIIVPSVSGLDAHKYNIQFDAQIVGYHQLFVELTSMGDLRTSLILCAMHSKPSLIVVLRDMK